MRLSRILTLAVVLCALLAVQAGSANAAAIFTYQVELDPTGVNFAAPGGSLHVLDLDSAKDTRVIVMPPSGPSRYDQTKPSGSTQFSATPINGLQSGDTVIVRQPAASVAATESFVIPALSLNVVTGATAFTGSLPAGMQGAVSGNYRCDSSPMTRTVGAGTFSLPYRKIIPGEIASLLAYTAAGDSVDLTVSSGGESPCFDVDAAGRVAPPPGAPPNPTPFQISIDNTILSLAPSLRIVLRRGGTVLFDGSQDSAQASFDMAQQPLPGDVIDLYRPKTAPAPSSSMTIPPVSATFDPSVDLVGITAPAAGVVYAASCRAYGCTNENSRGLLGAPAGRTLLDFANPQGSNGPIDLRADDFVFARYANPDFTLGYATRAVPGDLVAPSESFKLPGKISVSALINAFKKGFKVKLRSSEAGRAKLTLAFATGKAGSAAASAAKPLATISKSVKAGTTTLRLKFTKSGKRAIKKFAGAGRRAKTRRAVLTSVVTDASGNVATVARTTKIRP